MKRSVVTLVMATSAIIGAPLQSLSAEAQAPAPVPAAPQEQGRPNVLVWMLDDVGYSQVSAYGGLVETPNIDRVAKNGLRYTNYHTAPICSAARASFLTGRMPHSVHIGGHATAARPFPGFDAHIPASAGTIAANLKKGGYNTFAVGKWDHLPSEDVSPAGPFTYWATGQGFDRFYGFLAADADNWNPILVRDVSPVPKPADPDYHLSVDMADEAIGMIEARSAQDPPPPFFMYWATGVAHAPHHAPKEWIERYRGKFDMGWDKAREITLRTQIDMGILPKGTTLPERPEGMPAWNSLPDDARRLYARQMEAFAASMTHADAQFGRILDALEASGQLDNTIVIITSDNGASAEGGPAGLYNEAEVTSFVRSDVADNLPFIEEWGGPTTYPHYTYAWAVAGDSPFRYYKQTTHEGGTRVPLIISWPKGIAARDELRGQFVHVSDISPTILAATGVPLAESINDVAQVPMEGESVVASFAADGDPRGGRGQYVELYGNKGLWWQGWSIVTTHRTKTWDWNTPATFDEPWELYDLVNDPGQTRDLAKRHPERVAQMSAMFDEQAARYNVAPIHNLNETMGASIARARADFERRGGKWRYPGAVAQVPQAIAPPISARSFAMTARLDLPGAGVTGPLFAYGGQMGGIGFYLNDGKPSFILNDLKGGSLAVTAPEALGPWRTPISLTVARSLPNKAGVSNFDATISAGGRELTRETVAFALPGYFGLSEVFGVGADDGSTVLAGYAPGVPFAGRISEVEFAFPEGPAVGVGH